MKILIVVSTLRSIGFGASRYSWELAEYLALQGINVTIASNWANRNFYDSKKCLTVVDLGEKGIEPQGIKFWLNFQKIINRLDKLVREVKPNLILIMNFPSTVWTKKYSEIPILCYPQDINTLYTNSYIRNLPLHMNLLWRFFRIFIRIYDKKKW